MSVIFNYLCLLNILIISSITVVHAYYDDGYCVLPQTLHGEWFSREDGLNNFITVDSKSIQGRGKCREILDTNNDNFTILLQQDNCYNCIRILVRTLNVLEKIETGCMSPENNEKPTLQSICKHLDPYKELITWFSKNPTLKNCRSSMEGVWKFAYMNRYLFTGECEHPEANITACQIPGSQFYIENQQFIMNYKHCDGVKDTQDAEVQYKCLGDWYIGKDHYWAVLNARESRIEEAYRCFIANRDDDFYISLSITAECNTLKTAQSGPERLHLKPVKAEYVPPRCKFYDNFTGIWMNTANFDAEVVINATHIVERWKPDTGRIKEQVYVCHERRDSRYVLARMGINGCQKDFMCFDFLPRHHNIIRYRKGKSMMVDDFSTVCSWTMFPNKQQWRYDILITKNPVSIKCPVAGKFKFEQKGDILFETRIRGGVTSSPRPNVKCQDIISDFSVCDADQKIIYIDAEYCISVDYFGRPVDIYSEPDHKMKCIGFWKENLKSYLITYDEEDAYSKFRCWVYQKADLNRLLMSESVGAFCHIKQDVSSYNASEGAQVSLVMAEYEREHDDCPMYFDDGTDPYRPISEQVMVLNLSVRSSLHLLLYFLQFYVVIRLV
ncbi:uncharacterized protein [Parasteatoda tepidariorum]|uniref:uncharacterized protein n=1 Tax=Parasteatoda tepidariorum TaxID=114398 RepID=UPI00077F97CB|nr:uncharacterized protein LOC107457106 [Parasteatoda tepidariorum]